VTKLREIYKCDICGNVVEIAHAGADALVCCGQPMEKLTAKTEDQGKEKHLPVIKEETSGIRVEVGSVHHPMERNITSSLLKYLPLIKFIGRSLTLKKHRLLNLQ